MFCNAESRSEDSAGCIKELGLDGTCCLGTPHQGHQSIIVFNIDLYLISSRKLLLLLVLPTERAWLPATMQTKRRQPIFIVLWMVNRRNLTMSLYMNLSEPIVPHVKRASSEFHGKLQMISTWISMWGTIACVERTVRVKLRNTYCTCYYI